MAPEDCNVNAAGDGGCSRFEGFLIYKAWSYGIYTQSPCGVEIKDSTFVDNTVSVFAMVLFPDPLGHKFLTKLVNILNSLFVGKSATFDCSTDEMDSSELSISSSNAQPQFINGRGRIAVMLPQYNQNENMWPTKPFHLPKKYPALAGLMRILGQ
jgi:hypothetical protein